MDLIAHAPHAHTDGSSVWLSRYNMRGGDRFRMHDHPLHQLSWAPTGSLRVELARTTYVLPAAQALWIPADVPHDVSCTDALVLHNAHIDPACCPIDWSTTTVVTVSPLLRELLLQLAVPEFAGRTRRRGEELLFDLLGRARTDELGLVMPVDSRALDVARALISDPADTRTLDEWGTTVAASGRTLARRFREETGCSFADWRSTVRLCAARAVLASGRTAAVAARQVGYRDVDSFSLAYRRRFGDSPSRRSA